IPSYTSMPEWQPRWREDMTVQQAIDMFKGKPLDFNPGERQSYSNSGYTLLGAIIEKASGKSYEDFVEQEIFAPLGMKRSRYGHDTELVPGRVTGYDRAAGGYRLAPFLSMTQPYSAGSLMSTVDDLALWAEALSSGKLIKRESLERMTTPAKLTTGKPNNYAYGLTIWEEEGTRIVEHSGGIPGFFSDLLSIPDRRLVVVVLSNKPPQELAPAVLSFRVAMKALGKPVEERKAMDLDPATLDEYVGVYRFDETLARTIFREGNKLVAQRTGGEKLEILATSRDDFFYPGVDSRIRFRRDAQGKISGMDFFQLFGPAEPGVKTDEPLPAERQAIQVDPSLYDSYAGVYEMMPGFLLTVTREGDRLMTQATGQQKFEIFPESETRFFLKVFDAQLEFQRGPDGKATGVTLYQGGKVMPAKRVK
ncbi:MAG: serine hydrolase, partial [Candidatus Aminicenantales bacterium]